MQATHSGASACPDDPPTSLGMRAWLAVLVVLVTVAQSQAKSYTDRAIEAANKREKTKIVLSLFHAAAHLESHDAPSAWNNLGVALMRAASDDGADPSCAIWSLASFELSRRVVRFEMSRCMEE